MLLIVSLNHFCAVQAFPAALIFQAHELEPNLATWRSMVDVWSSEDTSDEDRLDQIFGSLQRRNFQPTRDVQLHAAAAYARSGAWHKAMTWFDPAVSFYADSYGVAVLL